MGSAPTRRRRPQSTTVRTSRERRCASSASRARTTIRRSALATPRPSPISSRRSGEDALPARRGKITRTSAGHIVARGHRFRLEPRPIASVVVRIAWVELIVVHIVRLLLLSVLLTIGALYRSVGAIDG